ncbi:hypothetical protein [Erwinia phage Pecta]|nr:hypothetical protein [Erwinia phage Pecta]
MAYTSTTPSVPAVKWVNTDKKWVGTKLPPIPSGNVKPK